MSNEVENFDYEVISYGAVKDTKDKRDFRIAGVQAPMDLPPKFEIEDKFPSKNQYGRGSCTSQAQTHHKERQEGVRLSAPFVMGLTKDYEGDTGYGAMTRNTFYIVNKKGVCSDGLYPEPAPDMTWEEYIRATRIPQNCYVDAKEHLSQSFWRVENDVESIKQAIYQNKNSVVISTAWYREFNHPDNAVLPTTFSDYITGHATDCIGWDDTKQLLKIKNSWGPDWGDNGYFYIPYSIFSRIIWDAWCSLDLPVNMPVDNFYDMPRNWAGYMREKSFAFNPWIIKRAGRLPSNREIKGLAYGFWSADAVFSGKVKDVWLKITKPEAIKRGVIDKNENLIK